jgi:radical SAM protein with 4Fe4S-binding SPASM domain
MDLARIYRGACRLHSAIPMALAPSRAFPPLRVAFILTHRCNLRCAMCYVWMHAEEREREEPGLRELDTAEWLRVIDQTPPFSMITFTGGEPFVRPDIRELIAHAVRRRRLHLVTNATCCTEQDIDHLAGLGPRRFWERGLLSLGISLEGPEEVHDRVVDQPGAFARTMGMLARAAHTRGARKFPILDVKVVLTAATYGTLEQLYETCERHGADLFSIQIENTQVSAYGVEKGGAQAHLKAAPPVTEIPEKELREVLLSLKRRSQGSRLGLRFNPSMPLEQTVQRYRNRFRREHFDCDTAWTVMHVGPYGDVYPCFSYRMGNVREQRLMAIWNGAAYRRFRRELKAARIFPGCAGCCVMRYRGGDDVL